VQPNGTSLPKAATQHDQPVLCTAWSADGTTVFSGEKTMKRNDSTIDVEGRDV